MNKKLIKWMSYLSCWLRYKVTYLEMKSYVKEAIGNKGSQRCIKIKELDRYSRNIGKSYALVKLALKYNLTIATATKSAANILEELATKRFKSKKLRTVVVNDFNRGKRYDTLLIEEGISEAMLNDVVCAIAKNIVGYIVW